MKKKFKYTPQFPLSVNAIHHKLELFIKHVETGLTPSDDLMKFMAWGAQNFLDNGKAWVVQYERNGAIHDWGKFSKHLQYLALKDINVASQRIETLTGKSWNTISKNIRNAKKHRDNSSVGKIDFVMAIEELLESELVNNLQGMEVRRIRRMLAALQTETDDKEPFV